MSLAPFLDCPSTSMPRSGVGRRLKLVVEYNGTAYAGSQRQAAEPSVQSRLEEAISGLTGTEVTISLAGRTDAGVHARGQVISFRTASDLPLRAFVYGLNHHLPPDIAIRSATVAEDDFDPRRQAIRREYEYLILNREMRSPLWQNLAYHLPGELEIDLMNEAAALILGEHDFASFACGLDDDTKSTVRRIYEAHFQRENDIVAFHISGNAFLPHQVRSTVGTLIRVGQGKLSTAHFEHILEACQPGLAGPTVPACGLYLNKVIYNDTNSEEEYENI
ncbi:MAG: tRNA pseudouridine(38-40) synthase TruA [Dehalococcoidia bacterium]|nr:tRNA pseudouridine(38-40) synthase TruA [Dehalococcoidia bacterium]